MCVMKTRFMNLQCVSYTCLQVLLKYFSYDFHCLE